MATPNLENGGIAQWTFDTLDSMLVDSMAQTIQQIITTITPFVTIGLTLSFMFYGIAIMRGAISMPMLDFLGRSLKIALVASFGAAGGLYQTDIASILISLPDDLASAIFSGINPGSMSGDLDAVINDSSRVATDVESSWFPSGKDIQIAIASTVIVVCSAFVAAVGGAILIVIKVAMGLVASVGPFFIVAILFEHTKGLFDRWVSMALNYTLLGVLVTLLFKIIINMQLVLIAKSSDWLSGGKVAILSVLGGYVFFFLASIVIFVQLPSMASSLASGFSLQFSGPSRRAGGAAKQAGKGIGSLMGRFRR